MKLKYTTRHLNFYFLKIHILRLLFCVYIVGMAGFLLASRRNDGQETNKKSFGKSSNEVKRAKRNLRKMDINAWFDEATPLMLAAKAGSVHDLTCLVNAGANVNACNNKGETAIIIATMHHQYKTVKALLGHNADIIRTDNDEKTALTHAQKKFTIDELKKLKKLESSAEIEEFESLSILQAHRGIEDLLCTRFAHDQMKELNTHIRVDHCSTAKVALTNKVTRRRVKGGYIKTVFPSRWPEIEIIKAIKSVLHSPFGLCRRTSKNNKPTLVAEGKFKDVSIRVIIAKQGSKSNVMTAYPLID